MHGFWGVFFEKLPGKIRFLERTVRWPCHGDPAFTYCDVERAIAGMSMLRRAPRVAQVADVAAFLASDRAAGVTGTIVNVTCGLLPG